MQIAYIEPQGAITLDAIAGDFLGLIRGIIEHLYLEQVRRIIQVRDGFDQPLDDVAFVVDRKLYSYLRPIDYRGGFGGDVGAVPGITIDQPIAMDSIGGEHSEDKEVWDDDGQVEGIKLINSAERVTAGVGNV